MLSFDISNFDTFLLTTYFDLLRDSLRTRILKEADFSSERFYWARLFHERKKKFGYVIDCKPSTSANSPTKTAILSVLRDLEKKFPTPLSLVDVGSGPFSAFCIQNLINRHDLEIVGVDPLADFYKKLHRKFQTRHYLKCLKGYGETLDKLFDKEHFHLAVTQNALDHSMNPKLFMQKLFGIVKPGGYLIITGYINIGSVEKWQGLHKWNIDVVNGELMLSNKSKTIYENLLSNLNVSPIKRIIKKGAIDSYFFSYIKNDNIKKEA
jgi:SAM-dependent methyltransferase